MILVTGGCGFIGSHLCDTLISRGEFVRVLDDLSTGLRANLPRDASLIVGDVSDPDTVASAMAGVSACFHLAAIASVQRGIDDWRGAHQVNLTGAITVLDAARSRRVPVIYASSAATYGDSAELPITEDARQAPLSAYGADKLGCELHARVASRAFGVPTTGLRFFNVYGPRQDPRSPYSGVISIFAERLRCGQPVDIFGDGSQTRDFVDVRDVVAALLAARDRAEGAQVFNVCTGVATSVLELARTLGEVCGHRPDLRLHPPRDGDIRHSLGSPDRARAALGLGDAIPLRAGLAELVSWMGRGD